LNTNFIKYTKNWYNSKIFLKLHTTPWLRNGGEFEMIPYRFTTLPSQMFL
jgi:hypothetical protein